MTEQWQELKETVTELRDNDGTGTQQEVCKFLANLMEVLEKQMQDPEDAISRQAVKELYYKDGYIGFRKICELPPVTPQPKTDVLDKIRAGIEKKIVKRPWLDFEDRERDRNDAFLEVLDIIDKYKAEIEPQERSDKE